MAGYTKLSSSLVTSTVWRESAETRVVWITMLALADQHGEVAASIPGLADMARVSIEACRAALAILSAPDPDSRTQEFDGRRIEAIDGGWVILNHAKYRDLYSVEHTRALARERQRRRRTKVSHAGNVTSHAGPVTGHDCNAKQKHKAEAEAIHPPPHAERFPDPDQRMAYLHLREAASHGVSFDAGLQAVVAPPSGGMPYGWDILGRALHDFYVANGAVRITPAQLRAFCRRLVNDDSRPVGQMGKAGSKQERGREALAETLRRRGFTNGQSADHHQVSRALPRTVSDAGSDGTDR